MDENKNNSITLPSGAVAVLKATLTAGDFIDASDTPDGKELSKIQLSKRLMDAVVVSVNGSSENVPNALRSLPLGDYVALSKEVAKLIQGDFTTAKTPLT
jgi:hypothetical protein